MQDTRTHYVPYFLKGKPLPDGRERAVCETPVTAEQIAPRETLPTCDGCRMWVENLDVTEPQPENQAGRAASTAVEAA